MKLLNRLLRHCRPAALLVGMAALWFLFAPTQFGGQASYVIIAGASMEPTLHTGDLVVARQSRQYNIGDVVTYQHPYVGPVIHRIIDKSGPGYVLRGDNNDWIDSYEPTSQEVLGKAWITIPGAARYIQQLRTQLGLALLSLSLGAMFLATLTQTRSKGEQASARVTKRSVTSIALSSTKLESWTFPLAVVLMAGILLGVVAYSSPLSDQSIIQIPYEQKASYSYFAKGPSEIYDEGRVLSGDAIFHSLVNQLRVYFDYEFSGPLSSDFSGSYQIRLVVSEPNGWHREVQLVPSTELTTESFSESLIIDIKKILGFVETLARQTEFTRSAYDVRVVPIIEISTTITGKSVEDRFMPVLHFRLDDHQLYLDGTSPLDEQADPLRTSKIEMVDQIQLVPAHINILGLELRVDLARQIALITSAIALLGIILLTIPTIIAWRRGESSQIAMQYQARMLEITKLPKMTASQTLDVRSFSDLAKLSDSLNIPILHLPKKDKHTYLLVNADTIYRYTIKEASTAE